MTGAERDFVAFLCAGGGTISKNNPFSNLICPFIIGEFELMNYSEHPLTAAKNILDKNTVVIMFPFLRSEITIISAQSNMPSLVLSPLNKKHY